jgi:hypothetical protein
VIHLQGFHSIIVPPLFLFEAALKGTKEVRGVLFSSSRSCSLFSLGTAPVWPILVVYQIYQILFLPVDLERRSIVL